MGKFIKKFSDHTDYQAFILGRSETTFVRPNVSLCVQENDVHYNKKPADKLQSILDLNLTEYGQRGEWHPTSDELAYIQESYDADPCCGAVTFPDTTYYAKFYTSQYYVHDANGEMSFICYVDENGFIQGFGYPLH